MIIQQKSATGSDGYYPRILITAPTGSVVTVNGIVITGIIGETTDTYTYVCNDYGTYTVVGTLGSETKTISVSVDNVTDYNTTISYRKYLYNLGDECSSVTGGWVSYQNTSGIAVVTRNATSMNVRNNSNGGGTNVWFAGIVTSNSIDVTNYSTLNVNIISRTAGSYSTTNVAQFYTGYQAVAPLVDITSTGVFTIDISTVTGTTRPSFNLYIRGANITFDKIWLE